MSANVAGRIFRAAVLDPCSENTWRFYPDGGVWVDDGKIVACGDFDSLQRTAQVEICELDGLIVPGFVDIHIHWVQQQVRGRFHESLLTWLSEHIWREEARFADTVYASEQAVRFFHDTLRAGTTTGVAYSSVHPEATLLAFERRRGDWIFGNSIMDRDAPAALTAFNVAGNAGLTQLLEAMGAQNYALTPRFALGCTDTLLRDLGMFAQATGCYVQTHLSESTQEVSEVHRQFPEARDYTDVYDRAGLLTSKTVLGHCIHLSPREWQCLAQRDCVVAHCPSSNEALDSGRMDLDTIRAQGIRWALGSDVGAGPSHSMLHVMQRFLAQHTAAGVRADVQEALYRATLAGAECIGRGAQAGGLQVGKRADFVLLPRGSARQTDPAAWFRELIEGTPTELEQRPLGTWLGGERQSLDTGT